MSGAKHTPGPWRADLCLDGWGIHEVYCSSGREVARMSDRQSAFAPDDEEGQANARLIAAAPDLLSALQRLIDSADVRDAGEVGALKQARAAIAKATGKEQQ